MTAPTWCAWVVPVPSYRISTLRISDHFTPTWMHFAARKINRLGCGGPYQLALGAGAHKNVAARRAKRRFVNIAGTGYNGRNRFAGRYSKGVVGRGQKRSAKGRRVQHRLRRTIPNVPWGTGLATAALQDRSPGRDNRCKKRDRHTCLPGNKGFCAPSGSSSKLT